MPTKIDWYILKKFFSTFFFCMLLFTVIAVAVDSSEHTDDFVKSHLSTAQIIKQYYLGFVPWIWGLLYPLFVFIAVIFFTSKMAIRSEVIAIIASGTSYNRWLRPYLIAGLIFATGLWFANRYGIPKATAIKNAFMAKYVDNPTSGNSVGLCPTCFYKRIDPVTYVGIKYYDTTSKSASVFFLEKVRNGKVFYNLRAQKIEWDTSKRNWKLTNVTERRLDSARETLREIPLMNIDMKLKPRDLTRDEYLKDKLTTPELNEFIATEKLRGREGLEAFEVEAYRRSATPFTVLLLTIIGAIIAGRKTRGGSGLHLALGIIIASLFILSDRFSTVFSVQGNLPALLAAWIPNIIFSVVALYLYARAPK
ncbi:MAG TPA: LptF/LptG family permease [Flavisolibacter sp.]|jgi:lipopolysaccharide export system permease protein|nr:LptF/LptG family permease [Flavisolibacter sp.]